MSVIRRPFTIQRGLPIPLVLLLTVVANAALGTSIAAQEDPFEFTVYKANCQEPLPPPERGIGEPDDPITEIMPDGCTVGEGVTFTFYADPDDTELASCTTDESGTCTVLLPAYLMNADIQIGEAFDYFVIEEDESTGQPGYSPVENPIRTYYVPTEFTVPYVNIVNVRDETSELPDTGAGASGARAADTWVPVLLSGGLLLIVASIRSRPITSR